MFKKVVQAVRGTNSLAWGGQAWNPGGLGKGSHTLQLRDSDEDLTRTVAIG